MRRMYLLASILCLFSVATFAQNKGIVNYDDLNDYEKMTAGFGFGFDYGGFGANVTYYPQKNIGAFFGGGYALAGFGYNAGVKLRIMPTPKFTPFFMAMYGYYSAVHVQDDSRYDKIFYGPTIGVGCDLGTHIIGKGVFSLALFVPFRNSETNDYIDYLENNSNIRFKNKPLPIGISVGYKFNVF